MDLQRTSTDSESKEVEDVMPSLSSPALVCQPYFNPRQGGSHNSIGLLFYNPLTPEEPPRILSGLYLNPLTLGESSRMLYYNPLMLSYNPLTPEEPPRNLSGLYLIPLTPEEPPRMLYWNNPLTPGEPLRILSGYLNPPTPEELSRIFSGLYFNPLILEEPSGIFSGLYLNPLTPEEPFRIFSGLYFNPLILEEPSRIFSGLYLNPLTLEEPSRMLYYNPLTPEEQHSESETTFQDYCIVDMASISSSDTAAQNPTDSQYWLKISKILIPVSAGAVYNSPSMFAKAANTLAFMATLAAISLRPTRNRAIRISTKFGVIACAAGTLAAIGYDLPDDYQWVTGVAFLIPAVAVAIK